MGSCTIYKPFIVISIMLAVLTIPVRLTAQSPYYFSNTYRLISEEDQMQAKYKKVSSERTCGNIRIETFRRSGDGWSEINKETFRKKNDSTYVVRFRGKTIFNSKYIRTYREMDNGAFFFTDRMRNRLLREGTSLKKLPLILQDTIRIYHENGRIKTVAIYEENEMSGNMNWLSNGNRYFDDLAFHVDRLPEYSLGPELFKSHILGGLNASGIDLTQISDRVVVGWVVLENGELEGFHIITGKLSELNSLLVKLIRELPGEWSPATLYGEPVRYYMQIPFNFLDRTETFENIEFSSGFLIWD